MDEFQPPKLSYEPARQPVAGRHRPFVARQLLMGLTLGTLFSAVAWIGGWEAFWEHSSLPALFIVPVVKVAAGVVLLFFRGWWSVGVGILVSMALGFLIFFGTCATHLKI